MNWLGVPATPAVGLGKGGRLKWLAVPSAIVLASAFFLGWRLGNRTGEGGVLAPERPPLARLVAEHTRLGKGPTSTSSGTQEEALSATAPAQEASAAGVLHLGKDSTTAPGVAASDDTNAVSDPAHDSDSYFIQVASLTSGAEADSLASALRRLGFHAEASPYGHSGGRWWHVVRIGPFEDRVDAESRRLDLARGQRLDAIVIPRARGHHLVQVASLLSRDNAVKLTRHLRWQGHQARASVVTTREGKRWHSVRIGPFDTREQAIRYRRLLREPEHQSAVVVPYEPLPSKSGP